MSTPILVLCVGNILAGDDGVGVHVADALRPGAAGGAVPRGAGPLRPLPPGVQVVDGGTLGLELLPIVEAARALVLVDAVELDAPAGTVRVLEGAALDRAPADHGSVHPLPPADLLAIARFTGRVPARVAVVGIQPGSIVASTELSDPVRAALPEAVDAVLGVVARFAAELESIDPHPAPAAAASTTDEAAASATDEPAGAPSSRREKAGPRERA